MRGQREQGVTRLVLRKADSGAEDAEREERPRKTCEISTMYL